MANYNAIRYDITWLQDGERLGPSAQACLVLADDMLKIESGKVTRKNETRMPRPYPSCPAPESFGTAVATDRGYNGRIPRTPQEAELRV